MWVVKLGGSLTHDPNLTDWLQALAPLPVVIVPGGGPFADSVRDAQAVWRFSDQAAHDMAILAMQQYGRMLADLGGGLATLGNLADWTPSDKARVWMPDPTDLADIPPSWNITSDSLAAWLSGKLRATDLLLVKAGLSGPRDAWGYGDKAAVSRLAFVGLIDKAFAGYASASGARCWMCGKDSHREFAERLIAPAWNFCLLEIRPAR